jgi:hypothetical protein
MSRYLHVEGARARRQKWQFDIGLRRLCPSVTEGNIKVLMLLLVVRVLRMHSRVGKVYRYRSFLPVKT